MSTPTTHPVRTGRQRSIIDEAIGQKFGKLTVIRFAGYSTTPSSKQIPMVEAKCECEARKTVSLWDLRSGKIKTCGVNHPHYDDRSIPAFNQIYRHSYKKRAEDAGIEFAITPEQFRELTQQPCHYCGTPPLATSYRGEKGRVKTGRGHSRFVYNGLDRKDSTHGYTTQNVVPCCSICNHAKHTMSYADFIQWLDRIAQHRSKGDAL